MSQETASRPVRTHRRRRTILLIAIALILVVAISLVAMSCLNTEQPESPTVTVDRGTVALAVLTSGEPTVAYGRTTLAGVAARVLAP